MSKTENELVELLSQLINSLETSENRKPGQFLAKELQSYLGCGKEKSYDTCKRLFDEGLIKPVKVKQKDMWGAVKPIPGWEVVNATNLDQR